MVRGMAFMRTLVDGGYEFDSDSGLPGDVLAMEGLGACSFTFEPEALRPFSGE